MAGRAWALSAYDSGSRQPEALGLSVSVDLDASVARVWQQASAERTCRQAGTEP